MFALVDAVSFYASAEKVFDPSVRNKPLVVLTNNDGCICAVCPIARKLGVPKFSPYYKVQALLAKDNVVVRSSNYELYADLSERMMNIIQRFGDNQYIYSIDESFLHFHRYQRMISSWHEYGHTIRKAIWKETRLPVGVGFGLTPTLAKAANHAAKKLSGYDGVAVIDDNASRKEVLSRMALTDVWGIGSRLGKKLSILGVCNAWELANQSPKAMKAQFGVTVERTINELNGMPCLTWDDEKAPQHQVFSTRSFGQRVTQYHALKAALVSHGCIVARKVRKQRALIKRLYIFVASSPHDESYYKKAQTYEFTIATDNTLHVASAISAVFDALFIAGVRFYRCGVGAVKLESRKFQQQDLFHFNLDNPGLMKCYDDINQRYGNGTVEVASAGLVEQWGMRRNFLSPRYTSKWQDIPKIHC